MIAKGVSAIIAGLAILIGIVISQPSQTAPSAEPFNSQSELATVSAEIGGSPSSACPQKSSSDTANAMCPQPTPTKTGYKAVPEKTYLQGGFLLQNLYGQSCSDKYVSGTCCGPAICVAKTCTTENGKSVPCGAAGNKVATEIPNGAKSDVPSAGVQPDKPISNPPPAANTGAGVSGTGGNATAGGNVPQSSATIPDSGTGGVAPAPPVAPVAPPPSPTPTPTGTTFASQPIQNIPSANPFGGYSGYQGGNASPYAPSQPTFSPTTFSGYSPSTQSPLMNFVTSLGTFIASPTNLSSIVNYLNGVYSSLTPVSRASSLTPAPADTISLYYTPEPVTVPSWGESGASQETAQQVLDQLLQIAEGGRQQATYPISATVSGSQLLNSNEPLSVSGEIPSNVQLSDIFSNPLEVVSSIQNGAAGNSSSTAATAGSENIGSTIPQKFFEEEASLAQSQSDYSWLQAQLSAWQAAQSAGVCDDVCQNALAQLQSEIPVQKEQVQKLQTIVDAGPMPTEASSSVAQAPTASVQIPGAGLQNVPENGVSSMQTPVPAEGAPYYIEQNNEWCDQYGQCIPQSSFASSPATIATSSPPSTILGALPAQPTQNTSVEDPVTQIAHTVGGWWSGIVSLFTPNVQPGQPQTCSLFKSLFGACNGW